MGFRLQGLRGFRVLIGLRNTKPRNSDLAASANPEALIPLSKGSASPVNFKGKVVPGFYSVAMETRCTTCGKPCNCRVSKEIERRS